MKYFRLTIPSWVDLNEGALTARLAALGAEDHGCSAGGHDATLYWAVPADRAAEAETILREVPHGEVGELPAEMFA